MEIIKVETKEQLKALNDCSAMTWEGLIEEDFGAALDMCGAEGAKGYVTKGKVMNEICHLTGSNAYPDDLTIFSIDKYKGLAIMVGARWMDDILSSNADREGYYPFKE
ncbi:hypothetical protein [Intestinibacter sp.]|uniref:hypothetical protein n=1 Tax=Intestinibacter sp. TaxID=1965304 RepID=UPI002A755197|nr:hypothetical protein [Intestinibacter sp.]MDY2735827.1 hypothetical protein [Intestinibacter sp.]